MRHSSPLDRPRSAVPPLGPIVLVGDPDDDARVILTAVLTHAGYNLRFATTGDELLREAAEDGVRLVLTEIRLPCADGPCAIGALKRSPRLRHIPVVAYSVHALVEDEAWAYDMGASFFLRKPTDLALVLEVVAAQVAWPALRFPTRPDGRAGAADPRTPSRSAERQG